MSDVVDNVWWITVKRGSQRVDWIERTVQPPRPRLSDEQHQRLVSALGGEVMIVLYDIPF